MFCCLSYLFIIQVCDSLLCVHVYVCTTEFPGLITGSYLYIMSFMQKKKIAIVVIVLFENGMCGHRQTDKTDRVSCVAINLVCTCVYSCVSL